MIRNRSPVGISDDVAGRTCPVSRPGGLGAWKSPAGIQRTWGPCALHIGVETESSYEYFTLKFPNHILNVGEGSWDKRTNEPWFDCLEKPLINQLELDWGPKRVSTLEVLSSWTSGQDLWLIASDPVLYALFVRARANVLCRAECSWHHWW